MIISKTWSSFNFLWVLYLVPVLLFHCSPKDQDQMPNYYDIQTNAWHLEPWGTHSWIIADYDGNVSLKNLHQDSSLWSFPAGAFVFDLQTGDLNRDGNPETAFVTAGGRLVILDHLGQEKWSFESPLALYNVCIGNFTGDANLEVACGGIDRHVYVFDDQGRLLSKSPKVERLVHRLAAGDLQGDPHDEILVIENRTVANCMAIEADSLVSKWRKPLTVPMEMINWENPRGNFYAFSVEIADLDYDQDQEIIMGDTYFNKQAVMVADHTGEMVWISERLPAFEVVENSQIEFYSTAFVRSGEVNDTIPGQEVISVAGGMIRIWDQSGKLLGSRNAKVGFTDFEIKDQEMYLSSSPNGDEYLYKINLNSDWQQQVANLEYQGKIRDIKNETSKIKELVEKYEPKDLPATPVYDLKVGFGSVEASPEGLQKYHRQIRWFREKFPYSNLRVINSMKVMEPTPPVNDNGEPWSIDRWRVDAIRGTTPVDLIVAKARWIEEHQIPTMFYIGHSCMPFISLETAQKILEVAPEYCVGFNSSEDENLERLSSYFEDYFKPLANLCLEYGNKKCLTKNKGLWWMSSPANDEVFNAMFEGGREKVSMAATEDSNSRTPEINLMSRGGLWQAGLLQNNDVSIHSDLFSFNRFQQWEYPKAGHPYLRLLIAHTTMGMTQVSVRTRQLMAEDESDEVGPMGWESAELFYHLLGKGIVFSPQPEDILGYSPLGLVIHKPESKWLQDAHNGHAPEKWEDDPELHQAVFPHNGNLWGMTNTPDHAFTKVIFGKERQFGYQVPATPYGLVAMVPQQTNLDQVANVEDWLHTDGIYIWREGQEKLTGKAAADMIKREYEQAAKQLLFRQVSADPAFMQVVKVKEDHYRLYLLDPGWVDPKAREVEVKIQMEGDFKVKNLLEKTDYRISEKGFKVKVPAGLFTIVEVEKESKPKI